ncbi:MAG TPA: hypothetical protein VJ436_12755 [Anaerolineales bacterium]|nr:hypothetical protein [Anaerolineales bacterium]
MSGGAPPWKIVAGKPVGAVEGKPDRRAMEALAAWLLPRLGDIFACAIFLGVLGLGSRLLNMDGDLGRHLTVGEFMLSSGQIPTMDYFSHSRAGQPLVPHEWLAQVSFALVYRLMGLDGVVLLSAALISLTFALVYRQCLGTSGLPLAGLGLAGLAAAASSLHWLARPHLFTILFLVVWTGWMERLRKGVDQRWWAPAFLMLAWANLHGAFVAGFAVWAVYLLSAGLESAWRVRGLWASLGAVVRSREVLTWLRLGLAAFAASLLNPVGLGVWKMSSGFLGSRYLVSHTAEYLPPDFQSPSAWSFLALIGASILLTALGRARLSLPAGLILVSWTMFGAYSVRNVPLYAVLAAPILAGAAGEALRSEARFAGWLRFEHGLVQLQSRLRGGAWPAAVFLLALAALAGGVRLDFVQQGNRFDPAVFPEAALDWVESQAAPGNVFNYFPWGGYLLYHSWPEQRAFIDGQTDFYGEAFTRQYEQVITLSPGWQEILRAYGVGWVLVPEEAFLAQALRQEAGWRQVYQDQTAVIFFRQTEPAFQGIQGGGW